MPFNYLPVNLLICNIQPVSMWIKHRFLVFQWEAQNSVSNCQEGGSCGQRCPVKLVIEESAHWTHIWMKNVAIEMQPGNSNWVVVGDVEEAFKFKTFKWSALFPLKGDDPLHIIIQHYLLHGDSRDGFVLLHYFQLPF